MKSTRAVALIFLMALTARCGGATGPQSGSESHFLDPCTDAAGCAAGLSCICGVCTRECAAPRDCTGLSSAATCGDVCGRARACEVSCGSSSDCALLGDGFECRSGACRQRQSIGTPAVPGPDSGVVGTPDAATPIPPEPDASPAGQPDATTPSLEASIRPGVDGSVTVCNGGTCLCDHLAACDPAEEIVGLPLGSKGERVCGVRIRRGNPGGLFCEVTAFAETEGGVTAVRCEAPLGDGCGVWQPGVGSPYCVETLQCNVLRQSCPDDLLDCSAPDLCSARAPSIDACCSGYAVLSTTGECGCVCDSPSNAPFSSLESCETACTVAADAGSGAPDASSCLSLETEIATQWAKVSECQSSADCTTAYNNLCASSGPVIGDVGCNLPIARSADTSLLSQLEQRYVRECFGQPGTCDCNALPPSECVAGHCRVVSP